MVWLPVNISSLRLKSYGLAVHNKSEIKLTKIKYTENNQSLCIPIYNYISTVSKKTSAILQLARLVGHMRCNNAALNWIVFQCKHPWSNVNINIWWHFFTTASVIGLFNIARQSCTQPRERPWTCSCMDSFSIMWTGKKKTCINKY